MRQVGGHGEYVGAMRVRDSGRQSPSVSRAVWLDDNRAGSPAGVTCRSTGAAGDDQHLEADLERLEDRTDVRQQLFEMSLLVDRRDDERQVDAVVDRYLDGS